MAPVYSSCILVPKWGDGMNWHLTGGILLNGPAPIAHMGGTHNFQNIGKYGPTP